MEKGKQESSSVQAGEGSVNCKLIHLDEFIVEYFDIYREKCKYLPIYFVPKVIHSKEGNPYKHIYIVGEKDDALNGPTVSTGELPTNCDKLEIGQVDSYIQCALNDRLKEEGRKLYHYTDMKAAISILQNGQNGSLCFWGTRYDSMEDTEDFIYAQDKVIPLFLKSLDDHSFDESEREDYNIYPYVVSFSEIEDDPNMWKEYRAEVAIELDYNVIVKEVEKLNNPTFEYSFGKCKYPKDDNELHQYFTEYFNNADYLGSIPITARYQTAFIKKEKYAFENEHRLLTCDYDSLMVSYNNGEPIFLEKEIGRNVKMRDSKDGRKIPYKEFHLPQAALKGLILNCKSECFESVKSKLKGLLTELGYNLQDIYIRKTKQLKTNNL